MPIWSAEIKELETLFSSLKGHIPELEKELERLIKSDDENMILLYSRRCLEVIITDLCECELKRPRKTEPLKGIIEKLHKEDKVPSHIISSMHGLNELSTYGTHPKDFDPEQIKPVLNNLTIIIKWYQKYIKSRTIGKIIEEVKPQCKEPLEEIRKEKRKEAFEKPVKSANRKLLSGVLITAILVFAAILSFPKIFKRDTLERLRSSGERISVAVMPFQNLTNDTIKWNIYQEIIQNNLTSYLSDFSKDLQVRQTESINSLLQNKGFINYASITPSFASTISQKLNADVFIYGKIIKSGIAIRISAQLIDTKTEEIIKSFQIGSSSKEENLLPIIDSLSAIIRDFLIISVMEKEIPMDFHQLISTNSSDAYRYYMYGHNAHYKLDYPAARDWFLRAIGVDSNFIGAITMLSYAYGNDGMMREAKKWCLKAYGKKNLTSDQQRLFVDLAYATFFGTPYDEIKYAKQLLELDDQSPTFYRRLGFGFKQLDQNEKAILEFEKVFELYKKWGIKPMWILDYTVFGEAYHRIGKYDKEKELYKQAEQDFPDDPSVIYRQAILSLIERDTSAANRYIEKYISIRTVNSESKAAITTSLAQIYSEAGILDKAEEYYQQALSLEPENPVRLNNLAYLLIDKDRDINEGLQNVNKALELSPDDYFSLHCKGWGLYKQGKYQEALEILQNSWDLRMKNAV
ncbi:MAG: tetratricopeptide repeat protein, partial [Bacteroidales bacterium]|nr:tetratricopeptide repeat protein [Bacteroidales bacterium]